MSWPVVLGALTAGVLLLLAALAFTLRMRAFQTKLDRLLARIEERQERERPARDKGKRDEPGPWKNEIRDDIDSVRSIVRSIASDTKRLVAHASSQPPRETSTPAPRPTTPLQEYDAYDEPRGSEDGLDRLLTIANRIVQQSSTTLEAFRANTGGVAAQVWAWPSGAEGTPAAFIVEHRGGYYAVPNVVKPARLPQEWFNRAEFGVNDEIQRVVSLPRLRRRGDSYDVQQPGVFTR